MIGRRNIIKSVVLCGASFLAVAATATTSQGADKTLKIGFVGVTSGPAAAWGTSNVRSMQTLAAWMNEKGVKIGDDTYKDFTGGKALFPATVSYAPEDPSAAAPGPGSERASV